jgi:hypothetical protein
MTIDQTDPANIQVLWVDGQENHVYLSESTGCFCTVLVNATVNKEAGKLVLISGTQDFCGKVLKGCLHANRRKQYRIVCDLRSANEKA